jgi:hypothetical protein
MKDDRQQPAFPPLYQLLEDSLSAQTAAIDLAVRRGALDLGTAAELLEHQAAARVGLARLLAPAVTAAAAGA